MTIENSVLDRISIIWGDITALQVAAIVNAANESLLGGGGVDGAIHRAAGPELVRECQTLGGCATGDAKITKGYNLLAQHVIHTVGPVYTNGTSGEPNLLASCYRRSLEIATEYNLASIAFPCVSTGVYSYPQDEACDIAIATVKNWLASHSLPEKVVFCCYHPEDAELYKLRLSDAD